MVENQVDELDAAGRFPNTGIVSASPYGGTPRAAKIFIDSAGPADLDAIARELNVAEDAGVKAKQAEESISQIDVVRERQEAPLTEEEQAAIDETIERARLAAEMANSVESRLGRIETVLERIAKSLEK